MAEKEGVGQHRVVGTTSSSHSRGWPKLKVSFTSTSKPLSLFICWLELLIFSWGSDRRERNPQQKGRINSENVQRTVKHPSPPKRWWELATWLPSDANLPWLARNWQIEWIYSQEKVCKTEKKKEDNLRDPRDIREQGNLFEKRHRRPEQEAPVCVNEYEMGTSAPAAEASPQASR